MIMQFTIRRAECEEDWDFFYRLGFETLKTLRKTFYDQLVKDNPGKSESELLVAHRKETEDYFDFDDSKARVFIAKNDDDIRCGYLWMGERNSEDYWDLQRPQWIYDIVVDPKFRGNGLGKVLMRKAEEFALEVHRSIGLFVHADNTPAFNLYKREGYIIKDTPMSKKVADELPGPASDRYAVREKEDADATVLHQLGLASYARMVRLSKDAPDEMISEKYDEYLGKLKDIERAQVTYVVETEGAVVGFVRAGVSGFNEKVGMVYDAAIAPEHTNRDLVRGLLSRVMAWCKGHELSTLYYLLHAQDDISQQVLQDLGFIVPGFFMEKDLVRTVPE